MPEAHSTIGYFRKRSSAPRALRFDRISAHEIFNPTSTVEGMLKRSDLDPRQGHQYSNETAWSSTYGRSKTSETLEENPVLLVTGGIAYNWYDLRNDGYDTTYASTTRSRSQDFYPKQSTRLQYPGKIFRMARMSESSPCPNPSRHSSSGMRRQGLDRPIWSISGKERQVFPLAGIRTKHDDRHLRQRDRTRNDQWSPLSMSAPPRQSTNRPKQSPQFSRPCSRSFNSCCVQPPSPLRSKTQPNILDNQITGILNLQLNRVRQAYPTSTQANKGH